MPDRIHDLGATVLRVPAPEELPDLLARIARLFAELHTADPELAAELLTKLPAMRIYRQSDPKNS